jgi:hypothetical protein
MAELPIVLVGFSAGGLAALLAADAPGVVGYVGLDAFDRPGGVGRTFARTLQVPALLLHGPPSMCNAFGISEPWAQALPRLVGNRLFDPATHCDFEDPTDRVCRIACGAPTPATQQAIAEAVRTGVLAFIAGPHGGAPGPAPIGNMPAR